MEQQKKTWKEQYDELRKLDEASYRKALLDIWSDLKRKYDFGTAAEKEAAQLQALEMMEPIMKKCLAQAAHHQRPDQSLEDLRSRMQVSVLNQFADYDADTQTIGSTFIFKGVVGELFGYMRDDIPRDVFRYQKAHNVYHVPTFSSYEEMIEKDISDGGSGVGMPIEFLKANPDYITKSPTEDAALAYCIDDDQIPEIYKNDPNLYAALGFVSILDEFNGDCDKLCEYLDTLNCANNERARDGRNTRATKTSRQEIENASARISKCMNFAKTATAEDLAAIKKNTDSGSLLAAIEFHERNKEKNMPPKRTRQARGVETPTVGEGEEYVK